MNKKMSVFILFLSLCYFFSTAYGEHTIKILAIGNSFSQDAAESYVDDLAKADGVKLIIANLYIGGCSLETHWNNAKGDLAAYSYRKINDGDTTVVEKQKLSIAIQDEDWDFITFQQVSSLSGMYNSYFPFLASMITYVKKTASNPNLIMALHQTWAYAQNSTHTGFANYNNNQLAMFDAIVTAVSSVAKENNISIIIPAGTAIQNGRTSFIGDNFCRDGYHLNLNYGRYTASCTWYEKLLNKPVIGNKFIPVGMSDEEAKVARYAAHYAVLYPNIITPITDQLIAK